VHFPEQQREKHKIGMLVAVIGWTAGKSTNLANSWWSDCVANGNLQTMEETMMFQN